MKIILSIIAVVIAVVPSVTTATPESTISANVTMLRPYIGGSIYVHLDSNVLCETSVFLIDGNDLGKDVMYSAALSALMGSKKIRVEALTSTGCTGWGTKLQSLYLLAN